MSLRLVTRVQVSQPVGFQLSMCGVGASWVASFICPFLPSDPSTIETNEEIEIAYPITCGESKAILLWKKFVCPGINVKCVKVMEFSQQIPSLLSRTGTESPQHFFTVCFSSEPWS